MENPQTTNQTETTTNAVTESQQKPIVPMNITMIPLTQIEPNPGNARKDFNERKMEALAQSIKEDGLLLPIHVRKIDDEKYQIVAGERRYRAYEKLGKKTICVFRQHPDTNSGRIRTA